MGRKKSYRGHYCWACGRIRANERFSGGGHKQHVCRDCQKLGPDELAYRQEVRNIERCIDFTGRIGRKHRQAFNRFLDHMNPRVRDYAQRLKADLDAQRAEWLEARAEEDAMLEELYATEPDEADPNL